MITSAKAEGAEQVILTDHNEFQQSVADIAEVEVYGVVDHHRVANFETAKKTEAKAVKPAEKEEKK